MILAFVIIAAATSLISAISLFLAAFDVLEKEVREERERTFHFYF